MTQLLKKHDKNLKIFCVFYLHYCLSLCCAWLQSLKQVTTYNKSKDKPLWRCLPPRRPKLRWANTEASTWMHGSGEHNLFIPSFVSLFINCRLHTSGASEYASWHVQCSFTSGLKLLIRIASQWKSPNKAANGASVPEKKRLPGIKWPVKTRQPVKTKNNSEDHFETFI